MENNDTNENLEHTTGQTENGGARARIAELNSSSEKSPPF